MSVFYRIVVYVTMVKKYVPPARNHRLLSGMVLFYPLLVRFIAPYLMLIFSLLIFSHCLHYFLLHFLFFFIFFF